MNEARKTLEALAQDATAEDIKQTGIFLNGLIYARQHPENKAAAALIEQIKDIIHGTKPGSRQEVEQLTSSLENILTAAAWSMPE